MQALDSNAILHYNIEATLQYKIGGDRVIPSQMLKGTLEGCVLAVISKQETYGYEISEQLRAYGFGRIAEGTIYPLLLRLEKNQLIAAVYRASDVGPRRKYYTLTETGRVELAAFLQSFSELSRAVGQLMRDMGGDLDEQTNETALERE